ncbi:MAG: UDP-N-acetylmuramoyl-L-alanine--D-glutamate ligase [Synergistaceae bacterium]|nr:UDP-N-acetylmuramoyl-L-alanine--D-glutamate ligase [Synergistaceae bacterium]
MKISVIGGGVSGYSLAALAHRLGNDVLVSDERVLSDDVYEKLKELGISYEIGHNLAFQAEALLLSSGIPPAAPVVLKAQNQGIPVIGELEFVLPHLTGNIIGITGTNGKSTVTSLVGHLLGSFCGSTAVGGNLGVAMADFALCKYDYIVLELSSAQLHYLAQRKNADFKIAVITNLAPDHIDWHGSYEKYIEAKARIISLLADDGRVFMREADIRKINDISRADKITALSWNNLDSRNNDRIILEADRAILMEGGSLHELFKYGNSHLIGKHNYENVAFSMAVLKKILGVDYDSGKAVKTLSTFKGLPHRCEFVAEINGVKYINDSKGTNVGACVTALNSIEGDKIIILGGKGKGEEYAPLGQCVKERAKHAIILGSERERIRNSLFEHGMNDVTLVDTIPEAVFEASIIASCGDIVLLSPACTSWDQYENYMQRGEHFRSSVQNLMETA